jgi:hypothetical protein
LTAISDGHRTRFTDGGTLLRFSGGSAGGSVRHLALLGGVDASTGFIQWFWLIVLSQLHLVMEGIRWRRPVALAHFGGLG